MASTHSGAKFKIEASPSSDAGYDATASTTLDLQLEASPALDVQTCTYSVYKFTSGATTPTLSSGGVASPPTAIVELTIGAGTHSYAVMCQTNGGAAVKGSDGKDDWTVNTSIRIVSVRNGAGLRKIMVGEQLQYDPAEGWTAAHNELVDAIGAAGTVTSVTGTAPINVATGTTTPVISITAATTLAAGSMSAADKTKLDAIGAGATVAGITGTAPITVGGTAANPIVGIVASSSLVAGSMSAADKAKLDASTYIPTASKLVEFSAAGDLYGNRIVAPIWYGEAASMTIGIDGYGTLVTFTDVPSEVHASEIAAPAFKSTTANPAGTGLLRAAKNTTAVAFRDDTNLADLNAISMIATNTIVVGGTNAEFVHAVTQTGGATKFIDNTTEFASLLYNSGGSRSTLEMRGNNVTIDTNELDIDATNVSFFATTGSFGGGAQTIYVNDAATEPTGDCTTGIRTWSYSNALKARNHASVTLVPQVESAAGAEDLRAPDRRAKRVTTADGTPTAAYTFAMPNNCAALFEVQVVGYVPADGTSSAFKITAGAKRYGGGNAALVGAPVIVAFEDNAATDAQIDISTTNVVVYVTGIAATTMEWFVTPNVTLMQP